MALSVPLSHERQPLIPSFCRKDRVDMLVPDEARKSVLFLGTKIDGAFQPRATAFVVSFMQYQHRWRMLVTAEHVVSGLLTKNQDIWLRYNLVDGGTKEIKVAPGDWSYHPDNASNATDVAACPLPWSILRGM